MRYRIEYSDNRVCTFANDRKDLISILKSLKSDTLADVRKLYKSGVSDSVLETYKSYIRK